MLSSIELIWRTRFKELLGIVGKKKPSSCLGWGPAAAMRKYWLFFLGDDCKIIDLVLLVPFKCMLICRGICYLFVLCLWVRFLCWNIGFLPKPSRSDRIFRFGFWQELRNRPNALPGLQQSTYVFPNPTNLPPPSSPSHLPDPSAHRLRPQQCYLAGDDEGHHRTIYLKMEKVVFRDFLIGSMFFTMCSQWKFALSTLPNFESAAFSLIGQLCVPDV